MKNKNKKTLLNNNVNVNTCGFHLALILATVDMLRATLQLMKDLIQKFNIHQFVYQFLTVNSSNHIKSKHEFFSTVLTRNAYVLHLCLFWDG